VNRGLSQNEAMNDSYALVEPSRSEVDALPGPTLIEFGAPWCGICKAAQPLLAKALAEAPALRHLKIEDGSGRPLGRSFGIKLWPTLIFMREGKELGRLVRPGSVDEIRLELARLLERTA
jgi:thioredoxin 1